MSMETVQRLKFLQRVVTREIAHLQYSSQQVFDSGNFDSQIKTIDQDPEFAQAVEAFSSRFCRLQDTLGDKLLPACLDALQEPTRAAIDNLDKAEKLGFLLSVDDWIQIRQLRNKMVHEYIESINILSEALKIAHDYETQLISFSNNMLGYLQQKQIL